MLCTFEHALKWAGDSGVVSGIHVTSQDGGLRCFCVDVVGSADAVQRHAVQGVPCLERCDSWDRLQPPLTLKLDKHKWMDGSGHGL